LLICNLLSVFGKMEWYADVQEMVVGQWSLHLVLSFVIIWSCRSRIRAEIESSGSHSMLIRS
jgi:hypothetical protein